MAKILDRVGEVYKNNDGLEMVIIKYQNSKYVTVQFESGYTKTTNMSTIRRGQVKDNFLAEDVRKKKDLEAVERSVKKQQLHDEKLKQKEQSIKDNEQLRAEQKLSKIPKEWSYASPYHCTVSGVGFHGNVDKTLSYYTRARKLWRGMLTRCYSGNGKDDSYFLYASVCKRWHSLELFMEDLPSLIGFNDWRKGKNVQLDKDLLSRQSVYSPTNCLFLEASINNQLQNKDKLKLARERISQGLVRHIPASKLYVIHETRTWVEFINDEKQEINN